MGRFNDLTGRRFGNLEVIGRGDAKGRSGLFWECTCDCGLAYVVRSDNLISGRTTRCRPCSNAALPGRTPVHGLSHTSTWWSWMKMKERCTKSTDKRWNGYGGRGITYCERWEQFSNFLADMGIKPEGMSLDRIDNDGDYEPGNCRWTDIHTQNNNRRNNLEPFTYNGETHTLKEWAVIVGKPYGALHSRITTRHWSLDQAFNTPIQVRRKKRNTP
jgi:hypothetical protein